MWILFLALIAIFLVYFIKKRRGMKLNPKIKLEYESGGDGNFTIYGKKDSFIIRKDNRFDFLVEKGQITACRDKEKSSKFVYYGGQN